MEVLAPYFIFDFSQVCSDRGEDRKGERGQVRGVLQLEADWQQDWGRGERAPERSRRLKGGSVGALASTLTG